MSCVLWSCPEVMERHWEGWDAEETTSAEDGVKQVCLLAEHSWEKGQWLWSCYRNLNSFQFFFFFKVGIGSAYL